MYCTWQQRKRMAREEKLGKPNIENKAIYNNLNFMLHIQKAEPG